MIGLRNCVELLENVVSKLAGDREALCESLKPSPLEGKTKNSAKTHLYKVIGRSFDGFFSDEYWRPINAFFKKLTGLGIDFSIDKAVYRKNDEGVPDAKTWKLSFQFRDKRGRDIVLYGQIVAAGAGSVKDPLNRYDVTFTAG